jgi:hypothetical protein
MKKMTLKVLVALGMISSTSFSGVYAIADQESDTSSDKLIEQINKSVFFDSGEKVILVDQVINFNDLTTTEQKIVLETLESGDVPAVDYEALQPTSICGNIPR